MPGDTLRVRGEGVCAAIKGMPFEPCFDLNAHDDRSFRGSVSGMGFAYCDFRHQGASQMLTARPCALRSSAHARSAEVSALVETPPVESARLEPVKSETRAEPAKPESAPELRRSTD